MKTLDKWNKKIDKRNYIAAVFVDLRKAFDIVNHVLLIDKLNLFRITEIKNKCFKSYFNNHTQGVSVTGTVSKLSLRGSKLV